MQKPGTARARPSSLLKRDEDHEKVFSVNFPIEVFRASIEISRLTEAYLRSDNTLSPEDRVNLKFYAAMHVSALACGSAQPTPEQVKALAGGTIDKTLIEKGATAVKEVYQQLGGTALVAKGSEFGEKLLVRLKESFPTVGAKAS